MAGNAPTGLQVRLREPSDAIRYRTGLVAVADALVSSIGPNEMLEQLQADMREVRDGARHVAKINPDDASPLGQMAKRVRQAGLHLAATVRKQGHRPLLENMAAMVMPTNDHLPPADLMRLRILGTFAMAVAVTQQHAELLGPHVSHGFITGEGSVSVNCDRLAQAPEATPLRETPLEQLALRVQRLGLD